jgi:hypothetical protein
MSIEDAVQKMMGIIKAACADAEVKSAVMSAEEARLSVYASAEDMQAIKDVAFMPAMDLLNNDGMDVQVFVYERGKSNG